MVIVLQSDSCGQIQPLESGFGPAARKFSNGRRPRSASRMFAALPVVDLGPHIELAPELSSGTRIGSSQIPAPAAVEHPWFVGFEIDLTPNVGGMTQHDSEDPSGSSPPRPKATAADMRKLAPATRAELLKRAKRTTTPIRKTFVQKPKGATERRSVLSTFVKNADERGLKAQLFLWAIISSGKHQDGWSKTLPLIVWARAFDTVQTAELSSATSAVSKILTRLEQRRLIERHRTGRERKVRVTILREDGSGDPYTHPAEVRPRDTYLKLPHAYWTEGWHEKLDLAATAMLLVALHEKPVFRLATEHMEEWYGWSPDTAEAGFKTLEDNGLLDKTREREDQPLSPLGFTFYNLYELTGPFKRTRPAVKTPAVKRATRRRTSGASTGKKTQP
ncbi:hypothetical protein [Kribbella sp. NPDC048928]|uniref:hypothetical protein n=1 Tax=Kribbella sp. NPDC048928 TaxID=3364111 RepID=UPI00371B8336